jgi:Ca2+-transporting ATPase
MAEAAELHPSNRPAHAEDIERLLTELGADPSRGLTPAEAAERLAKSGENRLSDPPQKSMVVRLLGQFASPLVLTLVGAAVIATVVGLSNRAESGFLVRFGDALAILLIVVINAVLGLVQERRAEAALSALKSMTAPTARVFRDGASSMINASELVPGDILEMEAGDFVPADARLLATVDFAAEEAALTGESEGTEKNARQPLADDAPLAERCTMVFLGTTVVRGKGRAVVVATGAQTELGKIGEMISHAEQEKTPLEQRLDRFGQRVLWACIGTSILLFAWGILRGGRAWHDVLLEAVSFAVAAIPEGLPAITTITLALGMQRMAKKGAVVRKLLAVETLGAASVICTDKTGTLTRNEMTVRLVYAARRRYRVAGEGYEPVGEIAGEDGKTPEHLPPTLDYLLSTAALCTNARLDWNGEARAWKVIGDPTEGALLALAAKGGRDKESVSVRHTVLRELPFDSDRKRMTIVTLDRDGREVAHVKGGLDVLLPLCADIATDEGARPITAEDRALVEREAERMTGEALRVLAIARRVRPRDNPEEALTLLGLVAMKDPPRRGVKEAIRLCAEAGVRTVMITGDHPLTAVAIARELELWVAGDEVITGVDLAKLGDDELRARAMKLRIFARTTAEQKLRIVNAYRALGHVVAMTGDGVNDAPALKQAHIGVAMGRSGTDVARQAADLVLSDDNFVTIVDAVREGRSIYRNIQKFIFFLLSSNAGLAVAVFVVSFLNGALPPTPLQILWINLVTNGLPALALGVDPPDPGHMKERPRPASAGLLGARDFAGVAFVGAFMGLCAVSLYFLFSPARSHEGAAFPRAMAFSLLALSPLFHAWSCRSPTESIFRMIPRLSFPLLVACVLSAAVHLLSVLVPGLRPVFRTFPMDEGEWLLVLGLSFAIVPAVEITKLVGRMRRAWLKIAVVAFLLLPTRAEADGIAIRPDMVAPGEIKIDGITREWSTGMTQLGKTILGSPGPDLGMRGAFAYDETNLYVAAEFKDPRLVRVSCSELEDHASLLIAFPTTGGNYVLHEVELFPGDPGKAPGCVKMKGRGALPGAKIVEAPKGVPSLYSFEAAIPWSSFPEAARTRVGLRAALRYYDGDGRAVQAVLGTSTDVAPADLPRFAIDAEQSLEDGLLREKRITSPPFRDRVADVAGDGMLERVAVYDRYMVILGPHFRGGREYYFADLGVDVAAGQMPMFEVRDLNGDGKAEIVMRKRAGSAGEWRETLVVLGMAKGEAPAVLFQHETGLHAGGGTVTDDVRFGAEGGKPTIEITAGNAVGYSAASYREPVETSMEPLLLPWGPVKAQTFQWTGTGFAKVREEKRARGAAAPAMAAETELAPAAPVQTVRSHPPLPEEMQEQVYALYKRERRVPAGDKPRFDVVADLAEDARGERLLLQDRDLVIFGKGYRGGAGYAFVTLDQFADPADIADVSARDITGDGKAEILVRGVVRVSPSKELKLGKGAVVEREVVLVYGVSPQGISRVFGAETGRALGNRRVAGTLAFVPSGRGMDIELRPGRAFGFTERTYPFGQDRGPSGGLEPLLLPWGGQPAARYHWNGASFAR